MNALFASSLLLFQKHLVRLVRSRRALFTILLSLLPALVALLVARLNTRAHGTELAVNLGWILLIQIVVPLVALIVGSSVVAEEIEDRTITYLFTRPIPRASILFGRLAATLVFLAATMTVASLLLLWACAGARGVGPEIGAGVRNPLIAAAVGGAIVYSALFAAAGAFFKHPMIVGLGYTFAIEGFLANLPGKNQSLTIQYHLRSVLASSHDAAWGEAEGFANTTIEPVTTAWVTLACIFVAAACLGAWRLSRREYELTS